MTTPWWSGLGAVDLPIECAGHTHHLHWADGVLTPADHPDAERERMLAALGADPYRCLELVDLWAEHAEDLEVLVQASRGPADPLGPDDEDSAQRGMTYRGGWRPHPAARRPNRGRPNSGWYMGPGGGSDAPQDGVARLLTLGGGLPDRLVAGVVGVWIERIESGDLRALTATPALKAALYGRLSAVVRVWSSASSAIALTVVESDHVPSLRQDGARLRAELPLTWLRDVWCRDLTTILGRLTLAARYLGDGKWELVTVSPDLGPPRTMTLEL